MRVTIKGDLVKSDNFKQIVDSLNEEFAPFTQKSIDKRIYTANNEHNSREYFNK